MIRSSSLWSGDWDIYRIYWSPSFPPHFSRSCRKATAKARIESFYAENKGVDSCASIAAAIRSFSCRHHLQIGFGSRCTILHPDKGFCKAICPSLHPPPTGCTPDSTRRCGTEGYTPSIRLERIRMQPHRYCRSPCR